MMVVVPSVGTTCDCGIFQHDSQNLVRKRRKSSPELQSLYDLFANIHLERDALQNLALCVTGIRQRIPDLCGSRNRLPIFRLFRRIRAVYERSAEIRSRFVRMFCGIKNNEQYARMKRTYIVKPLAVVLRAETAIIPSDVIDYV